MAVDANTLRRLSKLRLDPEQFEEVLSILADMQEAEEERLRSQRERKKKSRTKSRDSHGTVTGQDCDKERDEDRASLSDKERSPTPPKEINSPSSETNVSGVAALQSALAENVIVLADPRADLFGRGLRLLAGLTGKPEGKLRGLLGKWLKETNDDAVRVLRVIEDAGRNRVADAVSWIEAALKQQAQPKRQETHSERARRLNATWV